MHRHWFFNFNTAPTAYGPLPVVPAQPPRRAAYDVVVIGAGFAGLSTALELAAGGKKVLVCEATTLGVGPSGRSGGQLWPGFAEPFRKLRASFGTNVAIAATSLAHEALDFIHQRLAAHPTRCDFSPGVVLAAINSTDGKRCQQEARVLQAAGFSYASYVDAPTLQRSLFNTSRFSGGLLYQGDRDAPQYGHINPAAYLQVLAQQALGQGAEIAEHCPVTAINKKGEVYSLATSHGEISADIVVLATGAGFRRPKGLSYSLISRQFIPAQTLILATSPMTEEQAKVVIPGTSCFADSRERAMNYARLIKSDDDTNRLRLAFGGADALMQVQVSLAARQIERDLFETFPQLKRMNIRVEKAWGGMVDLTPSQLPVLAEPAPNLYQLCGFSGHGVVLTAALAHATARKILQGDAQKFEILATLSGHDKPLPQNPLLARLSFLQQTFRTHR